LDTTVLKMSKPTSLAASAISLPVALSVPALGGAWIATWSSVLSMSNSVVAVFGLASLLV
jgi:hypothetical protein